MVKVTPSNQNFSRANQDCDERQAILCELQKPELAKEYLAHEDSTVRFCADWAMEYYKIRCLRRSVKKDRELAWDHLNSLYRRLRDLAAIKRRRENSIEFGRRHCC